MWREGERGRGRTLEVYVRRERREVRGPEGAVLRDVVVRQWARLREVAQV